MGDEIIGGGDILGALLMGSRLQLLVDGQRAVDRGVAAAGAPSERHHDASGDLRVGPRHVDGRKPGPRRLHSGRSAPRVLLGIARPYLGESLSIPSDWTPLKHYRNNFHGYNQPDLDVDDPWQFKNFLVTDGD